MVGVVPGGVPDEGVVELLLLEVGAGYLYFYRESQYKFMSAFFAS